MEAKAIAKTLRMTPRKARLVADLVRGKSVSDAFGILRLTPKAACEDVEKVNVKGDKNEHTGHKSIGNYPCV